MNIKKLLREPLLYLLPLVAVVYLITFPIKTDYLDNKISDVKLTRNNKTENIELPYSVNMATNEVFFISYNLFVVNKSKAKFYIIPDDCIQKISINGKSFPLDNIKGLCDCVNGAYFDFSKYVKEGLNNFEFRIINNNGPAGLSVELASSGFKHFSLKHYIFIFIVISSFILTAIRFKKNETALKIIAMFLASIVFWFIANSKGYIIPSEILMHLTIIFFGTSCIFLLNKKINLLTFIFILTIIASFMLIRGGLMYFKSGDYNNCLAPWVNQMRELSIIGAISAKIGDYNVPYLYILSIISRFKINDLFLIKLFSILFDIVLAYYAMKIVSIKFKNINVQIAAFFAIICVPTVILNGAFWAQCDVIYAALSIASLYYAFTSKSIRSFIFFGLAISFKLQTIFILPAIIVFIFLKKIKITHIWIPFVTFFITLIPALIAGKPFIETISIYSDQVDAYPEMVLNTPNIWVLLGTVRFDNFNFIAILMTGIAVASLLYFLYLNREKIISIADYVNIIFVFTLVIPMLLPRMHERYLFLADVFSVILVFFNKKRWYFAPIIISGSFMTYSKALFGTQYFVPIEYFSIIMIFVTIVAVKDLVERFFIYYSNEKTTA